ncbi:uncharacterized protein KZ484_017030 [Pholidichthys leucotaenia]
MAEGEERQRNPFNISRIPTMEPNRSDFPQDDCKEEGVQADQQLWNQERNSFVKQEEPEPPEIKEEWEEREPLHIKEEEEEFCFSQQGEPLVVKVEDNTFMVPPVYEENSHSEVKPNSEQLLYHNSTVTEVKDEERSWHADSKSTKEEEPKPKKRCLTIRNHSNSDDEFVIQWENETDYASTPTEPTSRDTSTPASPAADPSPATDQDHPAPEPSPAPSQFGTAPSTLSRTGKRKQSNPKQDLSTIFASMQEAERKQHREQMELQRQQVELNSLLVDEVRQSRDAEVAVRREEIAQNAALNNTLMAILETLARRV